MSARQKNSGARQFASAHAPNLVHGRQRALSLSHARERPTAAVKLARGRDSARTPATFRRWIRPPPHSSTRSPAPPAPARELRRQQTLTLPLPPPPRAPACANTSSCRRARHRPAPPRLRRRPRRKEGAQASSARPRPRQLAPQSRPRRSLNVSAPFAQLQQLPGSRHRHHRRRRLLRK